MKQTVKEVIIATVTTKSLIQKTAIIFGLVGILSTGCAFAEETVEPAKEKVRGTLSIWREKCEVSASGGGRSCGATSDKDLTEMAFELNLSSHANPPSLQDPNHSDNYETKLKLRSGGEIFASIFVNHLYTMGEDSFYIVSLNLYGYDQNGNPLFQGSMISSSTQVTNLGSQKEVSLSGPEFYDGKIFQRVVLSASKIVAGK